MLVINVKLTKVVIFSVSLSLLSPLFVFGRNEGCKCKPHSHKACDNRVRKCPDIKCHEVFTLKKQTLICHIYTTTVHF